MHVIFYHAGFTGSETLFEVIYFERLNLRFLLPQKKRYFELFNFQVFNMEGDAEVDVGNLSFFFQIHYTTLCNEMLNKFDLCL